MQAIDLKSVEQAIVFALMYGASGAGKTHIIGTLCELGHVLLIDIDKGSDTIANAPDLQGKTDNLTAVSFETFGDLDTLYKLIKANDPVKWSKAIGIEILVPFDWVVWDTWSELQWNMLQQIRVDKQMLGVGLNFRKNIEIQHWGMMTDLNKLAIEELRKCNVNQIFIMQECTMKDELSGQIIGGPAIHGKMVQEMPAYFNVVAYVYSDLQGVHCARTVPKGRFTAKTRLGAGGDYKNPKASDLFVADRFKKK